MSEISSYSTDIAVIGAGPVGLFTVFEAGMLKMSCHVIDTLEFVGGQCTALYPEKPIYDIPGHPEISAQDLIENLEKQAAAFKPTYHLGQQVTALKSLPSGGYELKTTKDVKITAKAVVIAAGCGAFGPNRPPLADLEKYEGKSVFYLVRKRSDFEGKRIVIAGGGDSAVDWAISLSEVAAKVYVVHRRPKFRCAPESASKLEQLAKEGKIEMVVPYQLDGLKGNNGVLEEVIVKTLEGQSKSIPADVLLPFFGLAMELGPIAEWGLDLEHSKFITVNPQTQETNAKGIFAVGDIASYPGKLKLILNGFAEAAMASHAIYPLVHPNEVLHFEYSTTSGVPKEAA
jgi:thioredoxin reductase (NADPH)